MYGEHRQISWFFLSFTTCLIKTIKSLVVWRFGLPQTNDKLFSGINYISFIRQMGNYTTKLCPLKPKYEFFISSWKYIRRSKSICFLAIYCKYNLKSSKFKDLILKPINQTHLAPKGKKNFGAKYLGKRTKRFWFQNFY